MNIPLAIKNNVIALSGADTLKNTQNKRTVQPIKVINVNSEHLDYNSGFGLNLLYSKTNKSATIKIKKY